MRCEHDDAPPWTASPVTFRGQHFVFLKMPDGGGMLAEPEQLDGDNHVRPDAFYSDPFAHVRADGMIRRYGQTIGTVADLLSRAV